MMYNNSSEFACVCLFQMTNHSFLSLAFSLFLRESLNSCVILLSPFLTILVYIYIYIFFFLVVVVVLF